jgi:hypothetical protein
VTPIDTIAAAVRPLCGETRYLPGRAASQAHREHGSPLVLVDSEHNVIHLSERAGRYLQFGGGESTLNLLRVVHPMLREELLRALYSARQTAELVEVRNVSVEIDGAIRSMNLRIQPANEIAPGFARSFLRKESLSPRSQEGRSLRRREA